MGNSTAEAGSGEVLNVNISGVSVHFMEMVWLFAMEADVNVKTVFPFVVWKLSVETTVVIGAPFNLNGNVPEQLAAIFL